MIVRKHTRGWKLYFHRAHALLSMKIAMALGSETWPLKDYWVEGLSSITAHDDGQQKWVEKNHLNDAGAPLDYRDQDECDLEQAERVVNNAKYKSSFIALLVSKHCHELYKNFEEKSVQDYLKDQKKFRDSIVDHHDLPIKKVEKCYEFLRWCDELSLLLCQGDLLANERKIEIGKLGKFGMITIHRTSENLLVLDPWCFTEDKISFNVEYFVTSKLKYNSDTELKDDINLARPEIETLTFSKA